jgi:hypothetical protein
MLGIDDDKPIIIEGEYALAMMEELRDTYGLNEEQEKFFQGLREDVRNRIKRNLTFIKISKDENVKTNKEHRTVQDTEDAK